MLSTLLNHLSPGSAAELAAAIDCFGDSLKRIAGVVRTLRLPEPMPTASDVSAEMAGQIEQLVGRGTFVQFDDLRRMFSSPRAAGEWFGSLAFPLSATVGEQKFVHRLARLPDGRSVRSVLTRRAGRSGRRELVIPSRAFSRFVEMVLGQGVALDQAIATVIAEFGGRFPSRTVTRVILRELRNDAAFLRGENEGAIA